MSHRKMQYSIPLGKSINRSIEPLLILAKNGLGCLLLLFLLLLSCARQTTPTGGPKDTIPPVLVNSYPPKEQINFKGREVELTFNEMVVLNNPKEQIIITPDIGKKYKIEFRKKTVFLNFEEPLKDSTTYSINFREAVQDITEKNSVRNLKLAFSTGPYIDSLSIEGTVLDLLQAKEFKDATVALYQSDTFNIFKHKPVYVTRTNDKGEFKIENLKPGNYFIYAIQDKNKNLITDSKTESYGFVNKPIELVSNEKNVSIHTVRLDARSLSMISARLYNTYFNVRMSKGLSNYTIQSLENDEIVSCFSDDRSNIKIYNTLQDKDSSAVRLIVTDSINNKTDTTFVIKFNKRQASPEKFDLRIENFRLIQSKGVLTGMIKFTKPVAFLNLDSVFFRIDSTKSIHFTPKDLLYDSLNNILTISRYFDKSLLIQEPEQDSKNQNIESAPRTKEPADPDRKKNPSKPKIENQLYLGASSFISIESDSSKKITQTLKPVKLEDTGVIMVDVETNQPHFLLELLDKNFKVIQTKRDTKKISFEDLEPSEYQIRLVIDNDNNGKWSPGNFFIREVPEPVIFYRNENNQQIIKLRANFEIGPLLINY